MHMGVDISAERDAMALEAAETAMRLDPTSSAAHLAMGFYHYWGHKDYDAAMVEFDIAQKILPNSFDVLSARAFVRRRQGKWEGALEDLERALEINPLDYRAHYEVGLTKLALQDFDGAREMLQQTLNISPDFTEGMFWSAQASWVEDGDLAGGRAAVNAIPPGLIENWVTMARYTQSILERNPEEASAALAQYDYPKVNYMPMVFPVGFLSGRAKLQLNDDSGARSDLESSATFLEAMLEEDPDDYTAMPVLGLTYAMLGRSDEALTMAARAAELYGMDRDRFFGLNVEIHIAWIEALVGEQDAAIDRLIRLLSVPNLYLSSARLAVDPAWDPLRDNPRFEALLAD
jgi:serine/threonine-protein kinase